MSPAALRTAAPSDLAAVLDLYRHLHPDEPPPEAARADAAWAALMSSGLMCIIMAEIEGALVSTCALAIIPNLTRGARPYGVIENVVTHPDFRRMGLGRAVLAAAVEEAWQADCYKVLLATGSRRETTLRFYEGAGFERGGKTYFEMRRP